MHGSIEPHRSRSRCARCFFVLSRPCGGRARRYARAVSIGAAVAVGAVLGLLLGIVVSVASDLPLAPEGELVLGALLGWLWHREGST
jgi:hypothetical protein